MARRVASAGMLELTASQAERRAKVQAGQTVLANLRSDKALIAWAQESGLYVRIDRRSEWGNPFKIEDEAVRAEAIEGYRQYVAGQDELIDRLDDLRGKVLGCWCFPDPCHGSVLIELIEGSPVEHHACGGLCCPGADRA